MSGPASFSFGFLGGGRRPRGTPPPGKPREPLFLGFFFRLRKYGLKVSPHEWFAFLEGLQLGLARESLGGLYHLGRSTLVKRVSEFDLYDLAFADYFKDMPELPESLKKELEDWLEAGSALPHELPAMPEDLGLDLEELIRRFEETLKKQKEQHDGGSRWVGTHGTSPYGRDGRYPGGVRVGGQGGGRSAIQIAADRQFRAYRSDRTLDIRQLRVALRRLRELSREGPEDELDLPETIDKTGKNAGEIDLVFARPRKNSVKLLLLLDVGGSMTPYARLVSRVFSAAQQERHWKRLTHFYFHNCVYDKVYKDAAFREALPTEKLIADHESDWKVVMVGDACMGMSELLAPGGAIDWFEQNRRPLNPMIQRAWDHPSVRTIEATIPMFELTLDGLTEAVRHLKGSGV
jgi:uncharacterized protein with von Willebrand factor type A (vWA) domain